MPYLIAFIIIVIAGVAFTLTQNSPETDTVAETQTTNERNIEEDTDETNTPTETTPADTEETGISGNFSAQSTYLTPRRTEHLIDVNLTVEDGIITAADVLYNSEEPNTPNHNSFDEAYEEAVVGQPIAEVSLSRVGGSSLTSESFNEAVDKILAEQEA